MPLLQLVGVLHKPPPAELVQTPLAANAADMALAKEAKGKMYFENRTIGFQFISTALG